jgi:hypothetical protein
LERLDALGWVKEGRANYLRAAAADYARLAGDAKAKVLAVTPTWAEQGAFTQEVRVLLTKAGALGPAAQVTVHEPMKWTRAQARNPANYEPGMVATFNRASGGFRAGEFAPVTRIARGLVFVQTPTGERMLPLGRGSFSVSLPRPLEVAAGDRILIRANDRNARLLNGEIVSVQQIVGSHLQLGDDRVIDTAKFREFTHGYAVTSHASQGMTVDHVIVAAERLDAKAAYVACSRGRHTCTLHTPDKAALLDRLPSGNRAAALDMLEVNRSQRNQLTPDRKGLWAQARERIQALQRTAAHALDRGANHLREMALRVRQAQLLGIGARHKERTRQIGFER